MKKLTTILLAFAFLGTCLCTAKAVPRTTEKVTVKTELSAKIEKAFTATYEISNLAPATVAVTQFNPLVISELNRPPGVVTAKANDARFKLYNRDALPDKYKNENWRLSKPLPPNLGRTV